MPWFDFVWNDEPGGNVEHIADHDLAPSDVEAVVRDPDREDVSESSGRPVAFGCTPDGRYICVVYELVDDVTVYAVTAFEV